MPKILIVDDEKAIRRTLRDILEYEKYEILLGHRCLFAGAGHVSVCAGLV